MEPIISGRQNIRRALGLGAVLVLLTLTVIFLVARYRSPVSGQGRLPEGELVPTGKHYVFTTNYPSGYDSTGFRFFTRFEYFRAFDFPKKQHLYEHNGTKYEFEWDAIKRILLVRSGSHVLELNVGSLLGALIFKGEFTLKQEKLTVEVEQGPLKARFYIEDISSISSREGPDIYHLSGTILVGPVARSR
jgi:hypothetical protein